MSRQTLQLAVIIGSTRENRIGKRVADWFVSVARTYDAIVIDMVDLLDEDIPPRLMQQRTPSVQQFAERIAAADGVVIVTPEYNHSFPASLKQAIDWLKAEWQAKPVAFVSYGGISGGLRAVEHLRLVLAELHAVTMRDTVSLHDVHSLFDDAGRLKDVSGPEQAATVMLNHLCWWAHALRQARLETPYGKPPVSREEKVVTKEVWV